MGAVIDLQKNKKKCVNCDDQINNTFIPHSSFFFFLKQNVGKEQKTIVTPLSLMQVAILLRLVCAYENAEI